MKSPGYKNKWCRENAWKEVSSTISFSNYVYLKNWIRKQTTKLTFTVAKMNNVRNEIIDVLFVRNRENKIQEMMYFVVYNKLEWNKRNVCPGGKA